jgi:hypothetical protein
MEGERMTAVRGRGLLAAATAILAIAAAFAAGPAAPGTGHAESEACLAAAPAAAMFDSLAALGATSTARATDGRERSTAWASGSTEIPGPKPQTSAAFAAEIPVWFHVVAASERPRDGWVSDRQIEEQIAVMNLAFAGFYDGAETGFRFRLAGVTRTVNAEWFAQETFEAEVAMKSALKRGDATTLNVYSTSGGGFLGWAYYPSIVAQRQYQVLDGVVIHFDSVPGGKIRNYNLGFTAVHEAGHWLGLAHTFEGGCFGKGDEVDDTPAEATPTSGCPVDKDTCTAPGLDPVHNFMDYSYDACYEEFTPGQATRGQQQFLHWRVKHGY